MSLSRPERFPLLKLPFLCIECVIKSWDIFDIIFFALISQKTRRIVKILKIPLNRIQILVSDTKRIWLGGFSRIWIFSKPSLKPSFYQDLMKTPLMLRNDSIPLYTSRKDDVFNSFIDGNEVTALKMAMEFLNEVFNGSVEAVDINMDNYPESVDIGVESTVNLCINQNSSQPLDHAQSQKLSLLLENLEVTGTCDFWMRNTERDFYVDPKLFKCRKLVFGTRSAAWVTREILLQFEIPQLKFFDCSFSVEDILSFVTNWFHSENRKLEYLCVYTQSNQISLENFQTEELNPLPFSERTCIPPIKAYIIIDYSVGLEIVRHDGLVATIYVNADSGVFLFYIWHNQ
ncbi:unnamed protein product [Caenorhabditis brenneri]